MTDLVRQSCLTWFFSFLCFIESLGCGLLLVCQDNLNFCKIALRSLGRFIEHLLTFDLVLVMFSENNSDLRHILSRLVVLLVQTILRASIVCLFVAVDGLFGIIFIHFIRLKIML